MSYRNWTKQPVQKISDILLTLSFTLNKKINAVSIKSDGRSTDEPAEIVNVFNNIIAKEGPDLAACIPITNVPRIPVTPTLSLQLTPTTSEEVLNCINNLKDSSVGLDGIKAVLLKAIGPMIARPLSHIINLLFECGIFPQQLKSAIVTPIHKGKARNDVSNYRPVSVLTSI